MLHYLQHMNLLVFLPARRKKYDGRTKAGQTCKPYFIQPREASKEKWHKNNTSLRQKIRRKDSSETERAQKQIAQQKKLNKQKEVQKKAQDAKGKMQNKTKEMDTLMKARLSDFRKKGC